MKKIILIFLLFTTLIVSGCEKKEPVKLSNTFDNDIEVHKELESYLLRQQNSYGEKTYVNIFEGKSSSEFLFCIGSYGEYRTVHSFYYDIITREIKEANHLSDLNYTITSYQVVDDSEYIAYIKTIVEHDETDIIDSFPDEVGVDKFNNQEIEIELLNYKSISHFDTIFFEKLDDSIYFINHEYDDENVYERVYELKNDKFIVRDEYVTTHEMFNVEAGIMTPHSLKAWKLIANNDSLFYSVIGENTEPKLVQVNNEKIEPEKLNNAINILGFLGDNLLYVEQEKVDDEFIYTNKMMNMDTEETKKWNTNSVYQNKFTAINDYQYIKLNEETNKLEIFSYIDDQEQLVEHDLELLDELNCTDIFDMEEYVLITGEFEEVLIIKK